MFLLHSSFKNFHFLYGAWNQIQPKTPSDVKDFKDCLMYLEISLLIRFHNHLPAILDIIFKFLLNHLHQRVLPPATFFATIGAQKP